MKIKQNKKFTFTGLNSPLRIQYKWYLTCGIISILISAYLFYLYWTVYNVGAKNYSYFDNVMIDACPHDATFCNDCTKNNKYFNNWNFFTFPLVVLGVIFTINALANFVWISNIKQFIGVSRRELADMSKSFKKAGILKTITKSSSAGIRIIRALTIAVMIINAHPRKLCSQKYSEAEINQIENCRLFATECVPEDYSMESRSLPRWKRYLECQKSRNLFCQFPIESYRNFISAVKNYEKKNSKVKKKKYYPIEKRREAYHDLDASLHNQAEKQTSNPSHKEMNPAAELNKRKEQIYNAELSYVLTHGEHDHKHQDVHHHSHHDHPEDIARAFPLTPLPEPTFLEKIFPSAIRRVKRNHLNHYNWLGFPYTSVQGETRAPRDGKMDGKEEKEETKTMQWNRFFVNPRFSVQGLPVQLRMYQQTMRLSDFDSRSYAFQPQKAICHGILPSVNDGIHLFPNIQDFNHWVMTSEEAWNDFNYIPGVYWKALSFDFKHRLLALENLREFFDDSASQCKQESIKRIFEQLKQSFTVSLRDQSPMPQRGKIFDFDEVPLTSSLALSKSQSSPPASNIQNHEQYSQHSPSKRSPLALISLEAHLSAHGDDQARKEEDATKGKENNNDLTTSEGQTAFKNNVKKKVQTCEQEVEGEEEIQEGIQESDGEGTKQKVQIQFNHDLVELQKLALTNQEKADNTVTSVLQMAQALSLYHDVSVAKLWSNVRGLEYFNPINNIVTTCKASYIEQRVFDEDDYATENSTLFDMIRMISIFLAIYVLSEECFNYSILDVCNSDPVFATKTILGDASTLNTVKNGKND